MQSWKSGGNGGGQGLGFINRSKGHFCGIMGLGFWPGVASQAQHEQGRVQKGFRTDRWGVGLRRWKARGFRKVMVSGLGVQNCSKRKRRAVACWQCAYHSFWSCNFRLGGWGNDGMGWRGGCLAHAPGICSQAAESGCGHRRAGRDRQRKWRYTTREKEESHNWLPAEDDFKLAAVELSAVGQAHDALLVARQALQVHLLNKGKGGGG